VVAAVPSVCQFIQLNVRDAEKRPSSHHLDPLQRGSVHVINDPTHLDNGIRRNRTNVFVHCASLFVHQFSSWL
jgi:hypothetical protein